MTPVPISDLLTQGLRGVCDFLLSVSPLQWALEAPVVAVVEAKNENMKPGAGKTSRVA